MTTKTEEKNTVLPLPRSKGFHRSQRMRRLCLVGRRAHGDQRGAATGGYEGRRQQGEAMGSTTGGGEGGRRGSEGGRRWVAVKEDRRHERGFLNFTAFRYLVRPFEWQPRFKRGITKPTGPKRLNHIYIYMVQLPELGEENFLVTKKFGLGCQL